MRLHAPNRPRMFNRPTFTSETHVVPTLHIWPLSDDGTEVELSLMLPYSGDRYAASYKSIKVSLSEVPAIVLSYAADPEALVQSRFGVDVTRPLPSGPKDRAQTQDIPQPGTKPSLRSASQLL